jgi:pimeloyl-ACP methyl ester carboxylesterase
MKDKGRFVTAVAMRQREQIQKFFRQTKWRSFADQSSPPPSKGMLLEAEWVYPSSSSSSNGASTSKNSNEFAVILHGLMGNARNVKGLAQAVCSSLQIPSLLMDLRGHGKTFLSNSKSHHQESNSKEDRPVVTLQDCAWDVHRTLSHHVPELSLSGNDENVNNPAITKPSWTLMGHSLGGRIAMLYSMTPEIMALQQQPSNLWLLDTVPGGLNASVEKVIQVALQLDNNNSNIGSSSSNRIIWKSRKDLTDYLVDGQGIENATAQWLASSYDLKQGSFQFNLNVAQDLIHDFANVDFVGWLKEGIQRGDMRIDLVRGGANAAWEQQLQNSSNSTSEKSSSSSSMSLLEQIESWQKEYPRAFGFHTLPNAGHWVHIDDRKGLLAAIESVHLVKIP